MFHEMFKLHRSNTSNRYIKYTPEAVDKILGDFFEGMPQNEQRR